MASTEERTDAREKRAGTEPPMETEKARRRRRRESRIRRRRDGRRSCVKHCRRRTQGLSRPAPQSISATARGGQKLDRQGLGTDGKRDGYEVGDDDCVPPHGRLPDH